MRFLSMVRIKENSDLQPSEQLMADMGQLSCYPFWYFSL